MPYRYLLDFSKQGIDTELEVLIDLATEVGSKVGVLLVDADMQRITYHANFSARQQEQITADAAVPTRVLAALMELPARPTMQLHGGLMPTSFLDSDVPVWVLPLPFRDSIGRWILLVDTEKQLTFERVERFYLKLGWALTNLQLHLHVQELEKANEWIAHELEEMSRIQQLMLPDKEYEIPGADIAFTYRALKGAGGDYLDFVSLEEDKSSTDPHQLGIIVADVTGHGPSAAVEAAMLDAILRTFKAPEDLPDGIAQPSMVLDYVNSHFFTRKERGSFLTASVMHYCPINRRIMYANAGHPHAYLKRGNEIIPLDEGGIPVGVARGYEWQSYMVNVQRGDTVFIYTDVVIETKSPDEEDFGFKRLEQALRDSPNDPNKMLHHVEMKLKRHCHCKTFADDMTMCAVQFVL